MNSFSLKKKRKANATVLVKTENVSINNLEHIKVNKNSKNVVNCSMYLTSWNKNLSKYFTLNNFHSGFVAAVTLKCGQCH